MTPCNYQIPTPTPTATPVSLKIDTQEEAIQLRMATIIITNYGIPVSNARVDYDGDMIGETDNNGTIDLFLSQLVFILLQKQVILTAVKSSLWLLQNQQ